MRLLDLYFGLVALLCLLHGGFGDSQCAYDYQRVISWRVDKIYNASESPILFGLPAYNGFMSMLEMSAQQVETFRQDSLDYMKRRFGLPIELAQHDTASQITTIGALGYVAPVLFYPDYEAVAASPQSFLRRCPRLIAAEYTFFPFPAAVGNFVYGGVYGQFYSASGHQATMGAGDSLTLGIYHITEKRGNSRVIAKRITYEGRYPSRSTNPPLGPDNVPFQAYEADKIIIGNSKLIDPEWGIGEAYVVIRLPGLFDATLFQITATWIFSPYLNLDDYFN